MSKVQTEQEKEINTIRERTITLKLSDKDCERIMEKAGMVNMTASELLEQFIGDLVDGTYSNGSDERMKANDWFERCWFSFMNDGLLKYFNGEYDEVDGFMDTWEENELFKREPEQFAEEISELEDGEKLWFQEELDIITAGYEKEITKEDVELCRKWLDEYETLL